MIPYSRQSINQDDINSVVEVLKSDFLTQGKKVPAFENAICDYTGSKYGVAVNSGTSALHIACLSLGLTTGDILWTTPITFVASANCGLYCGAHVDFVDIDTSAWNIDVNCLKEKLIEADKNGHLPKVLIVVHMAGLPADMLEIHALSEQYGFGIVEDASHALGATYLGKPVGSCQYSDITVFSFHPVKSITTGEGGMAVTNNQMLANRMRLFAGHGITKNSDLMNKEPDGEWYYQQIELGYNYRLSDIHAALGISQLKRLDEFVQRRSAIASVYDSSFEQLPLQTPLKYDDRQSAYHLYPVLLEESAAVDRKQLFTKLREKGIGAHVHYIPVHAQPYYQAKGFKLGDFRNAENYYNKVISLPCFPLLKAEEQQYVIDTIKDTLT